MATDENRLGQWAMIARIAAAVIALVALVLGGGFFYNELWHVPDLRYSVLPTYNVGEVAFSGLVIENRGRVPARSVSIIVSDLEHPIEGLHMPGPHESVDTTWDAQHPSTEVTIEMERLSEENSLSIYMLTSGPVELVEGKTFIITSDQGKAKPSASEAAPNRLWTVLWTLLVATLTFLLCWLALPIMGAIAIKRRSRNS